MRRNGHANADAIRRAENIFLYQDAMICFALYISVKVVSEKFSNVKTRPFKRNQYDFASPLTSRLAMAQYHSYEDAASCQ